MDCRCISADCHIDLSWLPYDLFISNATTAMKDRMPYVVNGTNGWNERTDLLHLIKGKSSCSLLGQSNTPWQMIYNS